jgi:hypothetical protein
MGRELELLWRRIAECEDTYDPVKLDRLRREAYAALNHAG